LPTIEDIFNYVILLKQQLAQKDQIVSSLQNQLKELQDKNKKFPLFPEDIGELLSKCISYTSTEAADARYAINQLDQQLRLMGLRATIKIGIEKI